MPDDMDHVQAINEQWTEACIEQHRTGAACRALLPRRSKAGAASSAPTTCIDCESIIPAARLAAQPDATRCIECQRNFEIRRPL